MLRVVTALVLLTSTAEAAPTTARIELHVRKPRHFLGENALIDFCVVNRTEAPIKIDVGGDYRGSSRSLRFKVEVRDAAGNKLADPDPSPFNLGGLMYSPSIEPGKRWCHSLPLWRYARIDAPGKYTIRATHDLGWAAGTAPTGTAKIVFVMPTPTQAEAVVVAMAALPPDPGTSDWLDAQPGRSVTNEGWTHAILRRPLRAAPYRAPRREVRPPGRCPAWDACTPDPPAASPCS